MAASQAASKVHVLPGIGLNTAPHFSQGENALFLTLEMVYS